MRIVVVLLSFVLSWVAGYYLGKTLAKSEVLARISSGGRLVLFLALGGLVGWMLLIVLDWPIEYTAWTAALVGSCAYGEEKNREYV